MNLCHFSKSSILNHLILEECPLNLNSTEAKTCQCKRREYHVPPCDLRVLSCTWPNQFNGKPLTGSDDQEWIRKAVRKMNAATMEPVDSGQKHDLWGPIKIPVLGVCGEKFSGKTLLLASIDPANTCMIDLEDSSESYNIEFAQRVSLYDEMLKKHNKNATPLQCFEWFSSFVDSIKPGQFTVLAVDPISDIESGLVDWVKANPGKFGHSAAQYEKASGLLWMDVKSHWKMMLGILSRKVQTFAFSVHMGNVFKAGAPTGKRAPKGKETLFELASLYLEVERKPDDKGKVEKKPSAKVLKSRLAISKMIDGELEHFPILPPRLDVATPAAIRAYIKAPPDYAKLKKTELLAPEHLSDDDKLEIQREIAQTQLEVEQTKLTALEMLKQQTERQAELRLKQAAAAAATQKPESVASTPVATVAATTTATASAATTATFPDSPNPEACPFATGTDADDNSAAAKADGPSVWDIITAQKQQLGITDAQWLTILAKRNCKTTKELTAEQAEQIRVALWERWTKSDMAKATVSSKNSGSPATAS